jgi:hypothetical protein
LPYQTTVFHNDMVAGELRPATHPVDAEVVHGHDVRVIEEARDPRLFDEARSQPRAPRRRVQGLQRHGPAKALLKPSVDDPHAAATELGPTS